ncbi:hypothetical protein S7711_01090 [Stachybotrys chartarum IBT 7711]|uniref:Oxo-4-hydroxy-4-carboxy-5-ureidoimidazoline decarboxylase domain-containing protein n=1 Tax=Stachybotrys chartarum (strain CBS 109288 / IBT 7711) TaxID=1280523 RepID=A0A084B4E5_STACB|nr:hypothetical protein S7711_01090 [Stachybotrys chartarum IBT 7711]KFA54313.1 hypothetical protein S40293_04845 [Stachybotrys chartarum IBT 40293]KFA74402.1 hypothetical protein S40288_03998 [Stachybotrys chartarum IBT 40288]
MSVPLGVLPHIGVLHSCTEFTQVFVLDSLFEPSPAIHATLLPVVRANQWTSYPQLIDACRAQLFSLAARSSVESPDPTLLAILGSHPRLGDKHVDSAQSSAEQANLQNERQHLVALNEAYEQTFPGLRYVVFVNGRSTPEIVEDMQARIARRDYGSEVDAALQAMCDIAKDRASKLRMVVDSALNMRATLNNEANGGH